MCSHRRSTSWCESIGNNLPQETAVPRQGARPLTQISRAWEGTSELGSGVKDLDREFLTQLSCLSLDFYLPARSDAKYKLDLDPTPTPETPCRTSPLAVPTDQQCQLEKQYSVRLVDEHNTSVVFCDKDFGGHNQSNSNFFSRGYWLDNMRERCAGEKLVVARDKLDLL
ncbi:hypothetical protein B0T13DRAFT_445072 [Neurospora crassa]|nr:hypothetical protein B0T13DRAFT_445072 [Neurospora crassa]